MYITDLSVRERLSSLVLYEAVLLYATPRSDERRATSTVGPDLLLAVSVLVALFRVWGSQFLGDMPCCCCSLAVLRLASCGCRIAATAARSRVLKLKFYVDALSSRTVRGTAARR